MSDAPAIHWQWSRFGELRLEELYEAIRLRQLVFIVEQTCPFLDVDGLDPQAWHLLGWMNRSGGNRLLGAYVRIFPPGVVYREASIGRVVTHPDVRRTGAGRALMAEAIRRTEALAPGAPIRIGAQRYLEAFYSGFGFRTVSEPYIEDGIPHVHMVRGTALE